MDSEVDIFVGLIFILVGMAFIKKKTQIGRKAAVVYKKFGLEVPEDLYSAQFFFIGVLLIIVGFLAVSGLLQFL